MKFIIDYARHHDLRALGKVFLEVLDAIPYYNELAKEHEGKKYGYEELCRKVEEDPKSILVIKEGENIVAFCLSRFDDFTIWLEWFGVMKPYRGKSLSHLLLTKLEESARARHCHKIWCDTRTENEISIHILKRNGYQNIALLRNHWYSQDFFLWQKFLKVDDPDRIIES
jgi:ribosomal protein S18 acetylase RimI-like enzyme